MGSQSTQEILFSNYKEMHSNAIFTDIMDQVRDEIILEINRLTNIGYNTFVIGLADMFDILVAEALKEYRDSCSELQYFVIMYKDQHLVFMPSVKPRIEKIAQNADCILSTSKKYHDNVFQSPNKYLIDSFKMSVCYCNPYGDGGILYSYKRDDYKKCVIVDIINLFDSLNENSPLNSM